MPTLVIPGDIRSPRSAGVNVRLSPLPVLNGKALFTPWAMAKAAGANVGVGGTSALPALMLTPIELYVLELSSFPAETTSSLAGGGATIPNVTEDHMDRYRWGLQYRAVEAADLRENAKIRVVNADDAPATMPVRGATNAALALASMS